MLGVLLREAGKDADAFDEGVNYIWSAESLSSFIYSSTVPTLRVNMYIQSFSAFAMALFAQPIVAQFWPQSTLFLANCNTNSGQVTQVAVYLNGNGQNGASPDLFSNGAFNPWEGVQNQWDEGNGYTVIEQIDAGAQDPSIPLFGRAGCAVMELINGGAAVAQRYVCFKDNLRELYVTPAINCVSVYYCQEAPAGDSCQGMKHL
jgi:hypothetical protein